MSHPCRAQLVPLRRWRRRVTRVDGASAEPADDAGDVPSSVGDASRSPPAIPPSPPILNAQRVFLGISAQGYGVALGSKPTPTILSIESCCRIAIGCGHVRGDVNGEA